MDRLNQTEYQQGNIGSELYFRQAGPDKHIQTFCPIAAEYTVSSNTHGILSRISHILGNKVSVRKLKKAEIIPNIFSDHNGMKLETNNRGKTGKFIKMWKLNKMLLNSQWVTEEIKREIKKNTSKQTKIKKYNKTYDMQQKQC